MVQVVVSDFGQTGTVRQMLFGRPWSRDVTYAAWGELLGLILVISILVNSHGEPFKGSSKSPFLTRLVVQGFDGHLHFWALAPATAKAAKIAADLGNSISMRCISVF